MTRLVLFVPLLALLWGCGYAGDPLPPALNRPTRVTDLAAVERGSNIDLTFTVPTETTEGLPIKESPDIEVRIGVIAADHWDVHDWESQSERIPNGEIRIEKNLASAKIDARKYYARTAIIGVRVHGPGGRNIGWSNFESLNVVPALPKPEDLVAKDGPGAVALAWRAQAPEFRIFRRLPADAAWTAAGISQKPSFDDAGIEYGKSYQYFVQSIQKTGDKYAESEPSEIISFAPADRFPPAVPSGLTAVPGARTIELVWERNVEKDFAHYCVYRDGRKIAENLISPAFSDKDATPGARYRYEVSSVDSAGNESARSAPVEALIP